MIFGTNKGMLFPLEMTELIYDVSPDMHVGFDMGGISNLYWLFGLFGIIFGGVLYGFFVVLLHKLFNKYSQNEYFVILYLIVLYLPMDMFFKTGLINSAVGVNFLFNLIFVMFLLVPFTLKIKIKLF